MIKFHYPKHGRNRYCGPAVMSYLTGIPTHVASYHIRRYSGQRAVKSCHIHFLRLALQDFGYETIPEPNTSGLTISQWLHQSEDRRIDNRVFLVLAGRHYYLFKNQSYICGLVDQPTCIKDKSLKRRSRIYLTLKVERRVRRFKSDKAPTLALVQQMGKTKPKQKTK